MRILYLSPYPPSRDGIGAYAETLVSSVRAHGNEVAVVVPRMLRGAPAEVIAALASPIGRAELRAAVAEFGPDVIHVQFAVAAFGAQIPSLMRWLRQAELGGATAAPIVVTLHEVTREARRLPIGGAALFQWIGAHCSQLIVHTKLARSYLVDELSIPAGKVSVVPHLSSPPPPSVSTEQGLRARFQLGSARVLLAFGFIHPDKGLQDLIAALGIIKRTRPQVLRNVRVVLAGAVRPREAIFRVFEAVDHIYFSHLMCQAQREGVQDCLVTTGYVPAGDIRAWFELADAAVLPYRQAEQSGVASLARSLGVPVLASRVGGLAELFADSEWTFPCRAPHRLADVVVAFLAEKSRTSRSTITLGNLSTVTEQTIAIYRDLQGIEPGPLH